MGDPIIAAQVEAAVSVVRAEIERLTGSLEVALSHLNEQGHPEDIVRYARLHIEAALEGRSRPLILEQRRAEAAESERDALREKVAKARQWIVNCVDPAVVGVAQKQRMLDALAASPAEGSGRAGCTCGAWESSHCECPRNTPAPVVAPSTEGGGA